jgi:hypothetical protein
MNLDEIVGEIIAGRGSGMVEQRSGSAAAWSANTKSRVVVQFEKQHQHQIEIS